MCFLFLFVLQVLYELSYRSILGIVFCLLLLLFFLQVVVVVVVVHIRVVVFSSLTLFCFLLPCFFFLMHDPKFYTLAVPVPPDSPGDPPAENPFGLPSEYAAVLQER